MNFEQGWRTSPGVGTLSTLESSEALPLLHLTRVIERSKEEVRHSHLILHAEVANATGGVCKVLRMNRFN